MSPVTDDTRWPIASRFADGPGISFATLRDALPLDSPTGRYQQNLQYNAMWPAQVVQKLKMGDSTLKWGPNA